MNTIFMNSENSVTSDLHRLSLNLTGKINLSWKSKYIALSNLGIYYTWENIKKSYKNNKFKISASTWSEEFVLPDGSYSITDIQDYFEYVLKNPEGKTVNPSIKKCISKIENRITFKIKSGYYLELLSHETRKLLGNTKSKITKNKNGENTTRLEITEVVLIHCNVVYNSYQQNSRILYTFVSNKSFGQLLDISPENFIFSKTFDSEFSHIDVWFTDQNSKPLEIEDKINITLVIN